MSKTISPEEVARLEMESILFYTPLRNQWDNDVTRVFYDKHTNMFYEDDPMDPREFTVEEMQRLSPNLIKSEDLLGVILAQGGKIIGEDNSNDA